MYIYLYTNIHKHVVRPLDLCWGDCKQQKQDGGDDDDDVFGTFTSKVQHLRNTFHSVGLCVCQNDGLWGETFLCPVVLAYKCSEAPTRGGKCVVVCYCPLWWLNQTRQWWMCRDRTGFFGWTGSSDRGAGRTYWAGAGHTPSVQPFDCIAWMSYLNRDTLALLSLASNYSNWTLEVL